MTFAGFIITYHRPKILLETIEHVFAQSYPPEFLWIIDNSSDDQTKHAIERLSFENVKYHAMGHNAGPAGAAAKGLELCTADGADWIYWGDDNDPPFPNDCFERLFNNIVSIPKLGVIGAVGHFFDSQKGKMTKVSNNELFRSEVSLIDCVAGNMSMLVSRKVIERGIIPDDRFFFGFEELDFCLSVKSNDFEIAINSSLSLFLRNHYKRSNLTKPNYIKKTNLNREYYSYRNLLLIADKHGFGFMKLHLFLRWSLKSLFGFMYGFKYGLENFRLIWLAFFHYLSNKTGMQIPLNSFKNES
ncbi:glycosyltransferase [Belliella sp. DSM 111904]|uniref:Glycosyltransferase n=1 Tax=Belliella filtrata TaxID=2923435 RepID=A0ABS9UWX6_9BACT|nr:glycosyltransferase [Belliella filtrata]MCH7408651.1 glycosyltransferase [Belliella filtrata]